MRKVINPVLCKVYGRDNPVRGFAEIKWDGKRLSICGVVGPTRGGDCLGSAGQCSSSIRAGEPAEGWTREMVDKFCDLWDRWHLNDMHPECEHQRKLGWREQAAEKITKYNYRLTSEAQKLKKAAENAALEALRKGEIFVPTPDQAMFASMPYVVEIYEEMTGDGAKYYEPKKVLFAGDHGATETKTRGWVRFDESEKGILGKPCPVCGYKYGSSWMHEDVPQEVIDWLFALPDTKVTPAWV